jgi:hypothetical protein
MKSQDNIKKRYWGCIVYPDSAPSDWREELKKTGLPCAISPLHDKDLTSEVDEELKKAHWHVLLCWGNTTTYNSVKRITDSLSAPRPIPIESVKGYYRYFTHEEDPSKYQYSKDDIECLNGFSIADYADLTSAELAKIHDDIELIIRKNDFVRYADLLEFLSDSGESDMLRVVRGSTILYNNYLRSRNDRKRFQEQDNAIF